MGFGRHGESSIFPEFHEITLKHDEWSCQMSNFDIVATDNACVTCRAHLWQWTKGRRPDKHFLQFGGYPCSHITKLTKYYKLCVSFFEQYRFAYCVLLKADIVLFN